MSVVGLVLAAVLALILGGAVYLARLLEARRRAGLAAWAAAGGWSFSPGPTPLAVATDELGAGVARYYAHKLFSERPPDAAFAPAGALAVHLFELRRAPAPSAGRPAPERWVCLVADLGSDVPLAAAPEVPDLRVTRTERYLLLEQKALATAELYAALVAHARLLLGAPPAAISGAAAATAHAAQGS